MPFSTSLKLFTHIPSSHRYLESGGIEPETAFCTFKTIGITRCPYQEFSPLCQHGDHGLQQKTLDCHFQGKTPVRQQFPFLHSCAQKIQ